MRTASMRGFGLDAEQARGLAGLHAAPELPFGGDEEVLVDRIGMDIDLHPLAATGNHREHRAPGGDDPHVVLQLGHIFFGRRLFRERPRQHEFGLENRPVTLDPPVERCCHPAESRMPNLSLNIGNDLTSIGFATSAGSGPPSPRPAAR